MASSLAEHIKLEQWESESIPDVDLLFMRVHKAVLSENGEPIPSSFRDHGGAMSTEWNKYSTPEETLDQE